jgi:hypothetical protein
MQIKFSRSNEFTFDKQNGDYIIKILQNYSNKSIIY